MPWLLNEDEALKKKLQGITVEDENSPTTGRPVVVRFRLPDSELADVTFPMIVIDHAGLDRDPEREIRGQGLLPYAPEGKLPWAEYDDPSKSPYWFDEWPIPYNVDYNITVYSRKALHDRFLTAALAMPTRIPTRYGFLEIPQDHTVRRLDLLGGPEPDHTKDQDGKRIFRQLYNVRVSSELTLRQVTEIQKVLSVQIDLRHYWDTYDTPLRAST